MADSIAAESLIVSAISEAKADTRTHRTVWGGKADCSSSRFLSNFPNLHYLHQCIAADGEGSGEGSASEGKTFTGFRGCR